MPDKDVSHTAGNMVKIKYLKQTYPVKQVQCAQYIDPVFFSMQIHG